MKNPTFRLYFIDVMRAFAICMMLQGHFVDGLLANEYRNTDYLPFSTWLFFRGLTAPVFFTVSGFIFMYLLAKEKTEGKTGWNHVRVVKGIRRGITLIITAYLLRTHFWSLFAGKIYPNTYMVDVLHCIGLSLLFLIAIYLFSYRKKTYVMPVILLGFTLFLFAFAPVYLQQSYDFLPVALANYFTQANGSVFTIFPWFGYASFGAFVGVLFSIFRNRADVYRYAIAFTTFFGLLLSFGSQPFLGWIHHLVNSEITLLMAQNTIFNRLGNVMLIFSVFMLLRDVIMSKTIRTIGQNTLSIYIIHYIILYGSFTGFGLYQYFHHQLSPYVVIPGALLFVVLNVWLSFKYNQWKPIVSEKYTIVKQEIKMFLIEVYYLMGVLLNRLKNKLLEFIFALKRNS
ncbi:heparan-alpha-glucosaminide N-acetyltransferase domain-containing protein [Capnocytophaga sp.]|uniref:heparan-alpha-glucosaminide N-acetyltransferase domain-containing protein n=1 Tax=Capnocytophaga sp. TaxID=44737 RepID=UPI0026DBFF13|nr:heparan-alpha-glucosaminide N-acetyltransferase domain-containing protein [Capnocytophaga sp.]MDO5104949.1 heparan-alpha-glucosaminide N-acetyltransferase domain-containing protein [Capnocytophaga sp.]